MGGGSWTANDWTNYSTTTQSKTQQQIFTNKHIHTDMNPNGVKMRESRDSTEHPNSNAIIVALDETGSMGDIPTVLVKEKLGPMVQEILDRQPVKDPQILFMGIGDAYTDNSPLQVGQFESDISMTQWLEKIYLEGNGGGNGGESYLLAWYFAGMHTSIDCMDKRGEKGFLFTVGDEDFHKTITRDHIKRICGDDFERDITADELLTLVQRSYHVYHIMITEGHGFNTQVKLNWRALLGERAIELNDYKLLSETIVSILQVQQGAKIDDVIKSWSGDTSLVVASAIKDLSAKSDNSGLVRL